jgi:ketosteroid isomerase-like protein
MNVRELVAAYFDRMNAEDWEGLGQLFHEEAELEAPGFGRKRGREQVQAYFRSALSIYPVHYDDPVRVVISGDTATVNIHYEGDLANGHHLSFDAVDVFDMRDGLIGELTSWYDSFEVRRALLRGRARDEGPEGERARLRLALADTRGQAHAVGGRWNNGSGPPALCLPAMLLEVEGELTAEQAGAVPAGWGLLVRGASSIAAAALEGRPAGGWDEQQLPPTGSVPWAVGLQLDGIYPGPGALVSAPGADRDANAVFIT